MTLEPYLPPEKPEREPPVSLAEVMARIESRRPVHPSGLFDAGALTPKGVSLRSCELAVGLVATGLLGYGCLIHKLPSAKEPADLLATLIYALAAYGVGFCSSVAYSLVEHRDVCLEREKTEPSPWYYKMMFEAWTRRFNESLLYLSAIFSGLSLWLLYEFLVKEAPLWQVAVTAATGLLLICHLWRRTRYHVVAQILS